MQTEERLPRALAVVGRRRVELAHARHEPLALLDDDLVKLRRGVHLDAHRLRALQESEDDGERSTGHEQLALHLDQDARRELARLLVPAGRQAGGLALEHLPRGAGRALDLGVERGPEVRVLPAPEQLAAGLVRPAVVVGDREQDGLLEPLPPPGRVLRGQLEVLGLPELLRVDRERAAVVVLAHHGRDVGGSEELAAGVQPLRTVRGADPGGLGGVAEVRDERAHDSTPRICSAPSSRS